MAIDFIARVLADNADKSAQAALQALNARYKGQATLTVPAIEALGSESVLVPVPGAERGDIATGFAVSSPLRGLVATPQITGSSEATLWLFNPTGRTVDLGLCTIQITARQGDRDLPDTIPPIITSADPSGTYDEGVTIAGVLQANEVVSWSVSGADAEAVTLDPASGEWSLEPTGFESGRTAYGWSFVATDSADNVSVQDVAITIIDVEENPPAPEPEPIDRVEAFSAQVNGNPAETPQIFFDGQYIEMSLMAPAA